MSRALDVRDAPVGIGRRTLSMVIAAVLFCTALVVFAAPGRAAAADLGSTPITGVSMNPTTIDDAGTGRVDFTWVAPASAVPGDTFSITLPDELNPAGTRDILLVDETTGEVAVRGVWSGKVATFTFQSYLSTHTDIAGTGFFYVQWDHDVVGQDGGDYNDLDIGGYGLGTITKGPGEGVAPVTTRNAGKASGWTDPTQTSFVWYLGFPATTAADIAGPITISDVTPADPGYEFNCASANLRLDIGGYPSPTGTTTYSAPATSPAFTSYSCTPTTLDIVMPSIPAGSFYTLILPVTVLDDTRDAFTNTARFVWPDIVNNPISSDAEVRRDDSGGTVTAVAEVCVGNYVWIDTNNNGTQDSGESGLPNIELALELVNESGVVSPVLVDGVPMTTTTDASGLYMFCGLPVLTVGQKYRVTIDNSQSALSTYTATKSGGATIDLDSSSAESFADSVEDLTFGGASDLTLDFGYVLTSTPPVPPVPPVPPGELAQSGLTDASGGIAFIGALLLLYGGMLYLRARRRLT